ncbi:MAG: tRNA N6-adenosine threonylcarbamoyltransferase [Candidatus Parcubacteria bacterium]|jgi:hypothetical protein
MRKRTWLLIALDNMMNTEWFFIDTHERGVIRLARFPVRGTIRTRVCRIAPGSRRAGVNVPALCHAFFGIPQKTALQGVCVVAGPGSFSAVRSGVLVGNLLARMVGCPLVGVSVSEGSDLSMLRAQLMAGDRPAVGYVAPVYEAEPNITC